MRPSKAVFGFLLLAAPVSHAMERKTPAVALSSAMVRSLAVAAFQTPKVPFEARLMLAEWRRGKSTAEEIRMYFSPPESYRIEFLSFDGSVKKTVLTNEKNAFISVPGAEKSVLPESPLQISSVLSDRQVEDLLVENYLFELKGTDTFIGRPVWVLLLTPRTPGKPVHELKIDRETRVVLEQRRYLSKEDVGSLTRFSTFEPNKAFANDVFPAADEQEGFLKAKASSDLDSPTFTAISVPPNSFQKLPAGFCLKAYRTFQVEGTTANYFTYTDGALPLSVFRTQLPVKFPAGTSAADKLRVVPVEAGLSSADQVFYTRNGKDYFTVIGEVSPELLHDIADHFE
jgi:hypothetical protein